ncbi:ZIP Zinc transporter family protein [Tritrichomonas foetus]|uniref:ZIP Zinc transporter family protein n=1 Tax=Tritrichomonas foetus TaxID=1144522 RepID=A0A1J4JLV2_9EUKA|nr:ZIP Zinc transporter family protein [Tritrichomonas foetus]|eukprot:OHS98252.1 ZIP Zinc transporter family protein [Tritrichomonas foetus]
METLLLYHLISAILLFCIALIGVFVARFFHPGTYLIYAQTFASGAFLGIASLHFIPEASLCSDDGHPYYTFIIVGVFAFFSLAEMKALAQFEYSQNEVREISHESVKDFSVFLMHHFTALPSVWLQVTVFIFLILHSIVIGFAISIQTNTSIGAFISLVFATTIEKLVEAFTMTILIRKDRIKPFTFWTLAVIYSLATPATIIGLSFSSIHANNKIIGILISISSGVFLFIGLLLWRKTFLTPFDWQKSEIVVVSLTFFFSVVIQALTCIKHSTECAK